MKKTKRLKTAIKIFTAFILFNSFILCPIQTYATSGGLGLGELREELENGTYAESSTSSAAESSKNGKKDGVMDPIIEETTDGVDSAMGKIADTMVKEMVGSFGPSFFIYRAMMRQGDDIESGNLMDRYDPSALDENLEADNNMLHGNIIVNNLFTFAQRFGITFATLLTTFCFVLCLVGRSEQIKDSPISIFIKYIVACLLIYFSWSIIIEALSLFSRFWDAFVIKGWSNTTTLQYSDISKIDTKILGDNITGTAADDYLRWKNFLVKAFGWFLKLKLFKCLFKLYVEIAERYFIVTIMMFFFPAVCPTIISNSTTNIFHSYIRMFFSSCLLLCLNSLFMKVFVIGITSGAFTYDLLGYVCGLAFSKVCTKLDAYIASMGINIAQTGGGMMDSIGGAFFALTGALRTASAIKRSGTASAERAMAKAVANNDFGAYSKAAKSLTALGKPTPATEQSFQQMIHKNPTQEQTFAGNIVDSKANTHMNTANALNIPSTAISNLDRKLSEAGMKGLSGRNLSFKQIDGSVTPTNSAGSIFQVFDSDTHAPIGVIDGSSSYLANTNLKDDFVSGSTWSELTGKTSDSLPSRDDSHKPDSYTQCYTAASADGTTKIYSIYDYAAHPEMADRNSTLFKDGDHLYVMKSKTIDIEVPSNPMKDNYLDGGD